MILEETNEKSWLDFKQEYDLTISKNQYEIVKDIIALTNSSIESPYSNRSYLIIGVPEINNQFNSLLPIQNIQQLKDQIPKIISEYLGTIPIMHFHSILISQILEWQNQRSLKKKYILGSTSNTNLATQTSPSILIVEIIRESNMVYEVRKKFNKPDTSHPTAHPLIHPIGASWYRTDQHTFPITEEKRRNLRSK